MILKSPNLKSTVQWFFGLFLWNTFPPSRILSTLPQIGLRDFFLHFPLTFNNELFTQKTKSVSLWSAQFLNIILGSMFGLTLIESTGWEQVSWSLRWQNFGKQDEVVAGCNLGYALSHLALQGVALDTRTFCFLE